MSSTFKSAHGEPQQVDLSKAGAYGVDSLGHSLQGSRLQKHSYFEAEQEVHAGDDDDDNEEDTFSIGDEFHIQEGVVEGKQLVSLE